jgi:signal peptidase I
MCVSLFVGWILVSMVYFDAVSTYTIPSTSMLPTLMVGDYVVALKEPFRDRFPTRGEVVVFVGPDGSDFVKRVVGLPGDRIQVSGGVLEVNGRKVARTRIADFEPASDQGMLAKASTRYLETLPGGATHPILESSDTDRLDDTQVYTVPAGHVFVLGDNRDNSMDSRSSSIGFVALDRLRDRPLCIYWSREDGRIGQMIR